MAPELTLLLLCSHLAVIVLGDEWPVQSYTFEPAENNYVCLSFNMTLTVEASVDVIGDRILCGGYRPYIKTAHQSSKEIELSSRVCMLEGGKFYTCSVQHSLGLDHLFHITVPCTISRDILKPHIIDLRRVSTQGNNCYMFKLKAMRPVGATRLGGQICCGSLTNRNKRFCHDAGDDFIDELLEPTICDDIFDVNQNLLYCYVTMRFSDAESDRGTCDSQHISLLPGDAHLPNAIVNRIRMQTIDTNQCVTFDWETEMSLHNMTQYGVCCSNNAYPDYVTCNLTESDSISTTFSSTWCGSYGGDNYVLYCYALNEYNTGSEGLKKSTSKVFSSPLEPQPPQNLDYMYTLQENQMCIKISWTIPETFFYLQQYSLCCDLFECTNVTLSEDDMLNATDSQSLSVTYCPRNVNSSVMNCILTSVFHPDTEFSDVIQDIRLPDKNHPYKPDIATLQGLEPGCFLVVASPKERPASASPCCANNADFKNAICSTYSKICDVPTGSVYCYVVIDYWSQTLAHDYAMSDVYRKELVAHPDITHQFSYETNEIFVMLQFVYPDTFLQLVSSHICLYNPALNTASPAEVMPTLGSCAPVDSYNDFGRISYIGSLRGGKRNETFELQIASVYMSNDGPIILVKPINISFPLILTSHLPIEIVNKTIDEHEICLTFTWGFMEDTAFIHQSVVTCSLNDENFKGQKTYVDASSTITENLMHEFCTNISIIGETLNCIVEVTYLDEYNMTNVIGRSDGVSVTLCGKPEAIENVKTTEQLELDRYGKLVAITWTIKWQPGAHKCRSIDYYNVTIIGDGQTHTKSVRTPEVTLTGYEVNRNYTAIVYPVNNEAIMGEGFIETFIYNEEAPSTSPRVFLSSTNSSCANITISHSNNDISTARYFDVACKSLEDNHILLNTTVKSSGAAAISVLLCGIKMNSLINCSAGSGNLAGLSKIASSTLRHSYAESNSMQESPENPKETTISTSATEKVNAASGSTAKSSARTNALPVDPNKASDDIAAPENSAIGTGLKDPVNMESDGGSIQIGRTTKGFLNPTNKIMQKINFGEGTRLGTDERNEADYIFDAKVNPDEDLISDSSNNAERNQDVSEDVRSAVSSFFKKSFIVTTPTKMLLDSNKSQQKLNSPEIVSSETKVPELPIENLQNGKAHTTRKPGSIITEDLAPTHTDQEEEDKLLETKVIFLQADEINASRELSVGAAAIVIPLLVNIWHYMS